MEHQRLKALFEEFMKESEYTRRIRPTTLYGYRLSFTTFLSLTPNATLQSLTPQNLSAFFKKLQERKRIIGKGEIRTGIKNSTQATYWNKLSAFFSWLKTHGYLTQNPLSILRCPTPRYEDRQYLTKEDLQKILFAIQAICHKPFTLKRNLLIFHLLLLCGLRKQELVYLELRDVDFVHKMLTVRADTTKTAKARKIPLHSTVLLHLEDYLKVRTGFTTPYLIVSSQHDNRLSYDGLKHLVDDLKRVSGVSFHLHQFRHTFAVNFLKVSRDISKLRQLLGHSDIKMTALYLRCLPIEEIKADIDRMSMEGMI